MKLLRIESPPGKHPSMEKIDLLVCHHQAAACKHAFILHRFPFKAAAIYSSSAGYVTGLL